MGKGNKPAVQFVQPDPEPELDVATVLDDIDEEPPYTSIEHSTASGEGCAPCLPRMLRAAACTSPRARYHAVAPLVLTDATAHGFHRCGASSTDSAAMRVPQPLHRHVKDEGEFRNHRVRWKGCAAPIRR